MHYQRKETDLEREKFKYNQLKNQLNPHFLFNSLNTLSAMVYTKTPDESVDYIEKLSDFYRYVLVNEGKNLISLNEEIEIINKYGDILKTRFQDGFVLNITLNEEDLNKKILFMSLQLLVENAVKHNIASKEKPLTVNIYSENNVIVVSNNKVIRTDNVISTGIGLDNLNERYKIVDNKEIKIIDEKEKFSVKIPMI
jgi:LytS/YehU family sensor histidine kinase